MANGSLDDDDDQNVTEEEVRVLPEFNMEESDPSDFMIDFEMDKLFNLYSIQISHSYRIWMTQIVLEVILSAQLTHVTKTKAIIHLKILVIK